MIIWAGKNVLLHIPLFGALVGLVFYRLVRWYRAATAFGAPEARAVMLAKFSWSRCMVRTILCLLGIFFLWGALLRPQWGKKEETIHQTGRDLIIALDISRSMLATDCLPNRLACAKMKIKELVQHLSSERVGLILFTGSAFVQCPLTADYHAFFMFLDMVDVSLAASGTTALDAAIRQALTVFEKLPERKNKLLVVFTDGEDFSSDMQGVKERAAQERLCLFTVGVGTTEGAPVPVLDERGVPHGHQKDTRGSVVISRLNEPLLRSLAEESGGMYVPMRHDTSDVQAIVRRVEQFEKEHIEDTMVEQFQEQYPYCIAVSFLCFLIDWLI